MKHHDVVGCSAMSCDASHLLGCGEIPVRGFTNRIRGAAANRPQPSHSTGVDKPPRNPRRAAALGVFLGAVCWYAHRRWRRARSEREDRARRELVHEGYVGLADWSAGRTVPAPVDPGVAASSESNDIPIWGGRPYGDVSMSVELCVCGHEKGQHLYIEDYDSSGVVVGRMPCRAGASFADPVWHCSCSGWRPRPVPRGGLDRKGAR